MQGGGFDTLLSGKTVPIGQWDPWWWGQTGLPKAATPWLHQRKLIFSSSKIRERVMRARGTVLSFLQCRSRKALSVLPQPGAGNWEAEQGRTAAQAPAEGAPERGPVQIDAGGKN